MDQKKTFFSAMLICPGPQKQNKKSQGRNEGDGNIKKVKNWLDKVRLLVRRA